MNKLCAVLDDLKSSSRKAMGIFVTCGHPSVSVTVRLMEAIDQAGADFIELGMPFSDPLAEGAPIQKSSAQALANGVTLEIVLDTVANFRKHSDTPVLLMGYANPVLRFGTERFCGQAADSGVDGLIIPDLPPDDTLGLSDAASAASLSMVYLIAPNTPTERIRFVDRATTGFVYAVSFTGLTGAKLQTTAAVQEYLRNARSAISNPLMVGFGITNSDDAARMTVSTDGFIVGSALVSEIERLWSDKSLDENERLRGVESFVSSLRPQD